MAGESSHSPLHVFDLPQVYQKPSFAALQEALEMLTLAATNFESLEPATEDEQKPYVLPDGVPTYLTNILASSLSWIEEEDDKERIWTLAGRRLTERSGRTAMGDITRSFTIPQPTGDLEIKIHEPALTEDNLGLKTWSSSHILARRMHLFHLPGLDGEANSEINPTILELGSGTGLLGLASAAILRKHVILTDLPEIEYNLQKNIGLNAEFLDENGGSAECGTLDWQTPESLDLASGNSDHGEATCGKAMVILVADPIYSPEHPKLLVDTIKEWLHPDDKARVVMAYPIREAYNEQIAELRRLMSSAGLEVVEESTECGQDDWADEVTCSCSVWRWEARDR